jgi:hypothetical protein
MTVLFRITRIWFLSPETGRKAMKEPRRCDTCGRSKWGLAQLLWAGYVFCSAACKAEFLAKRARQIEELKMWLGHLKPVDGLAER